MVQTNCRTRNKQRKHESLCHRGKCRRKGMYVVCKILTLDIPVRASGKWAAPCSTRYRATSPWSASSYNLRFYTGGSSHALNIKEKERIRKVPLSSPHEWPLSHFQACDLPHLNNKHNNLPSMAYFISCANIFHMTSALILPTFSSWGNLEEAVLRLKSRSISSYGSLLFNKITSFLCNSISVFSPYF